MVFQSLLPPKGLLPEYLHRSWVPGECLAFQRARTNWWCLRWTQTASSRTWICPWRCQSCLASTPCRQQFCSEAPSGSEWQKARWSRSRTQRPSAREWRSHPSPMQWSEWLACLGLHRAKTANRIWSSWTRCKCLSICSGGPVGAHIPHRTCSDRFLEAALNRTCRSTKTDRLRSFELCHVQPR